MLYPGKQPFQNGPAAARTVLTLSNRKWAGIACNKYKRMTGKKLFIRIIITKWVRVAGFKLRVSGWVWHFLNCWFLVSDCSGCSIQHKLEKLFKRYNGGFCVMHFALSVRHWGFGILLFAFSIKRSAYSVSSHQGIVPVLLSNQWKQIVHWWRDIPVHQKIYHR